MIDRLERLCQGLNTACYQQSRSNQFGSNSLDGSEIYLIYATNSESAWGVRSLSAMCLSVFPSLAAARGGNDDERFFLSGHPVLFWIPRSSRGITSAVNGVVITMKPLITS